MPQLTLIQKPRLRRVSELRLLLVEAPHLLPPIRLWMAGRALLAGNGVTGKRVAAVRVTEQVDSHPSTDPARAAAAIAVAEKAERDGAKDLLQAARRGAVGETVAQGGLAKAKIGPGFQTRTMKGKNTATWRVAICW